MNYINNDLYEGTYNFTKDNGKMELDMEKVNISTLTEISTRDFGLTIGNKDKGY